MAEENAILALEEAVLATMFTQRALVELLIKKKIISKKDIENEVMKTESESIGAGITGKKKYFEKRKGQRSKAR